MIFRILVTFFSLLVLYHWLEGVNRKGAKGSKVLGFFLIGEGTYQEKKALFVWVLHSEFLFFFACFASWRFVFLG